VHGSTLSFAVFRDAALTSAVVMGMKSTTHWVDAGIPRRLVLAVTQAGPQATVKLPGHPNALPLGW
jgi:hypothetical protein